MGTGAFTLCRYSCRGKRLLESTTSRLRRAAEPSTAVGHPAEHTLSGILSTRSCTDPATLERGASRLLHPDQRSVTGRLEPSLDRPYRPQGASHRSRRPWAGHAGFNLGCYSYPRLVYDTLSCPLRSPEHLERSEEHTSELQSPDHLVCRLLLE